MAPTGRPTLDERVYKLRFRREDGSTDTAYYSDPARAEQLAAEQAGLGRLQFYAVYTFAREMT